MPFLRNIWYVVGFAKEFTNTPIRRQIIGEYLAILRNSEGTIRVIEDRCPHRFVPLSKGMLEGDQIRCGYHGLAFDTRTGACSDQPTGDGIDNARLKVRTYPAVEKYDIIWCWMGDAAAADPDLIPDFSPVSDPELRTLTGYIRIDGNVQLVADNLLDLSHVQFLHPEIAPQGDIKQFKSRVEQDGTTVWQRLFRPNVVPNAFQKTMWPFASEVVDSVGDVRWDAPGVILAFISFSDVGRGPEDGLRMPSAHLLTPATETSTHYFWSAGRNAMQDNAEVDGFFSSTVNHVFTTQDGPMIEAQQRDMGESVDFLAMNPVILKSDAAGIRARRVIQRLVRAEQGSPGKIANNDSAQCNLVSSER